MLGRKKKESKAQPPRESDVEKAWESAEPPGDGSVESALEAWQKTVDVQMHFNDICMKIRNLAITVLVATVGFAGYSLKEAFEVGILGLHIPVGTMIAVAGFVGWIAFFGMDRHWYHLYLRAAGMHAGNIEKRWQAKLPELLLSSRIAEESTRTVCGITFNSSRRLNWFYALGVVVLLITAAVVWAAQPVPRAWSSESATTSAAKAGESRH